MHIPSAYELLAVWERGLSLGSLQRGLLLLATLFPDQSDATLAQFSIGERDSHLLALREHLFGSTVASVANCPQCNEALELNFDLAAVRVPIDSPPGRGREFALQAGDYGVRCRVPNQVDLLAIALIEDSGSARRLLVERCILAFEPSQPGDPAPLIEQLPDAVTAAIIEQMAHADPQSDAQIALVCPACQYGWLAPFDILAFLWTEIAAWAQRLLREVHTLASAYGWREVEILTMNAWRRQMYLQMISE